MFRGLPLDYMQDAIADVLYDRRTYKADASWSHQFFTQPIGTLGRTWKDTNMVTAGHLPAGNRFLVTAVEIIFLPSLKLDKAARIADVNAAARAGVVSFKVQNREYFRTAPIAACPATRYWHQDYKGDDDESSRRIMAKLRADLDEQFRETDYGAFGGAPALFIPLYIECLQSFMVTVESLAPLPSGEDGELWCRLPGKRVRDIQ